AASACRSGVPARAAIRQSRNIVGRHTSGTSARYPGSSAPFWSSFEGFRLARGSLRQVDFGRKSIRSGLIRPLPSTGVGRTVGRGPAMIGTRTGEDQGAAVEGCDIIGAGLAVYAPIEEVTVQPGETSGGRALHHQLVGDVAIQPASGEGECHARS